MNRTCVKKEPANQLTRDCGTPAEMRDHAPIAPSPSEPMATIDLTSDIDMQGNGAGGGSAQQQGQEGAGQRQGGEQQQQGQQGGGQQQQHSQQHKHPQASSNCAGLSHTTPTSANNSTRTTPASKQGESLPVGSPHQNGVTGSASGRASSSASHHNPGSAAPGVSGKVGGKKGEGGQAGAAAAAAALRAKREEAELQHQ
eukprot:scaffold17106_cov18-Tisochrysis_lutea.AAC.1